MTPESIASLLEQLESGYSGARTAREGRITYVKLPGVRFPEGCQPDHSQALVVLDPSQPVPNLLVRDIPHLPNGAQPRSTNSVTVLGEGWYQYSFDLKWNETHLAVQFVEGRLRRFALNE